METHTYKVRVNWLKERLGTAETDGVPVPLFFSAPPEFGGRAEFWSPELLLVSAASSCFLSTFLFLADRKHLALASYEAETEGRLEQVPGEGFRFTDLVLRPVITVEKEEAVPLAHSLLERAEKLCPVANSLALPVRVEPRVEVAVAPMFG